MTKFLIVTQSLDKNNPILGFFVRWVEEFAKSFEKVTVICLEVGEYSLPENVRVLSLGKPHFAKASRGEGKAFISRLVYARRFYKYIWRGRGNYNTVFVHMNPEYLVLGGWLWKILGKKVGLWYAHKQVNLKLRVASAFADEIFTPARESFSLESGKINFVGHGVDTERFPKKGWNDTKRVLVSVGRITQIKNCEVLVRTLVFLRKSDPTWRAVFIGEPVTERDGLYKNKLLEEIRENGLESQVKFAGSLAPEEINQEYAKAFASVNMTPSGGMDKVVLESLSSGCPAFTANTAFENVFGGDAPLFIYSFGQAEELAERIKSFANNRGKEEIVAKLSNKVRAEYDTSQVIGKIVKILNNE